MMEMEMRELMNTPTLELEFEGKWKVMKVNMRVRLKVSNILKYLL